MKPQPSPAAAALRRSAEARLKNKPAARPPKGQAGLLRLQHELEVHQIELEMQNEELQTAQAQIAADLERYTDLYDFAPVGYCNLDADSTIHLVNLTGAKLMGVERSRLRGTRFQQLVVEADRHAFRDFMVRVFASESKQTCELALATAGRPAQAIRLEATRSPDGKECRVVLVDDPERERAAQRLAASEARLRAIFDTEPECVKLLASDGTLLEMNPAGLRMIEADSFRQVERHCLYPLVVAEHRAAFKGLNEKVFAGGSGTLEFQIVGLKGGQRWLETHASPLRDVSGQVTALLGITRDITARRQVEGIVACQTKVLEAIATGVPLAKTLTVLLRGMEAIAPGMVGSVLLLDDDGVHVRHGAAPSLPEAFNRAIEGQPIGPRAGSCGTAAYRREPVIVEDLATDPLWEDYRELALAHGLRACWSTPIFDAQQRVLGTFAIYYSEPGLPMPLHRRCIELATHLASVAISKHRSDVRHRLDEHRQATFATLGRQLNAATDATEAARIVVGIADELFGWDSCKLDRYDAQADQCHSILTVDIIHGQRQEVPPDHAGTPPSPRLRQLLQGQPELILRAEPLVAAPDRAPFGDVNRPSASIMAVPVREGGKVIGALSIHSYRLHAYTQEDLDALQALADHCGGALERIRGRAELQQERNLLRTVVDHLPDFIYVKDLESRFVLFNAASLRLMKLEREEGVLGRTVFDLFPPEQARAFTEDDQRVLASGQPVLDREEPITGQSGETRHLLTTKVPLCDASGQIVGLVGLSRDITERKRAEDALRVAEEKYRSIFEHSVEGIYQSTPEGRYLTVNPAMAQIYGYASPEAMVREITDIGRQLYADPEDRPKLQALLHAQGGVGVFECQMRRRDGSLIWIRQSSRAVRDAAGEVSCYEGSVEDITERRQTEAALRESEQKLRRVIDGLGPNNFVGLLAPDGALLEANRPALAAAGLRLEDVLGRPVEQTYWFAYSEAVQEQLRAAVARAAAGEPSRYDVQIRVAEGRLVWLDFSIHPLRDAGGRVSYLIPSATVIEERKHMEGVLQRRNALLNAVVEGTSDAVFAKDLEGRYLIINTAGAQALGRPAAEIIGHTDAEFVPEATARRFREADEAVMTSGQSQTQEEAGLMDGQLHHWHSNKAPMRDEAGRIIGVVGVARDITERMQAEQERQKFVQLAESSSEFIGMCDLDLKPRYVNPAGVRLVGLPDMAAACQVKVEDYFFPEDRAFITEKFFPRVLHEGHGEVEIRLRHFQTGEPIWMSYYLFHVHDASGRVIGWATVSRDITERKRTDAALREAQSRLKLSVTASNIGLWDWNLLTDEVYFSPEWKSQLGYAEDEIRGHFEEWRSRVHPDDLAPTLAKVQNFITNPAADYAVEFRLRHKDGSWRWIFTQGQVFRDVAGKALRMIGCHIDITERKQAEETLRKSEERFAKVFHVSPMSIAISTYPDGLYVDVNEHFTRTLGYSREDVVGRRALDFSIWADPRQRAEIVRRIAAGESVRDVECLLRAKSGELRIAIAEVERIVLDDQPCLLFINLDITQRKRAELELRESQQTLEKAQHIGHIGSWESDPGLDGKLKWSAETCRIFGFAPGEFDGRVESFLELLHPEDRERVASAVVAALAGERAYDLEHRIIHQDGKTRWVHEQADVERDPAGRPVRMVGVVQDITERKQVEAELVQLSGKLLRAQDEERRRLARELHDSTAQTLAALAMNLAIVSRTTALDAEGRTLLAECEGQVRRGTMELRTFAYLLHPPALEALGLARAAQDYAEGFAKRSGIAVTLDLPEVLVRLPQEVELALFRVLQESLGNLHRHSGSATATLRITHDTETIMLEVRDAGRGLDERQLAAARGGGGTGHGVGFAGMRERLRLLGGRLEFEAGLPGLIVRATLPLAADE